MKTGNPNGGRSAFILLAILLLGATVYLAGESLRQERLAIAPADSTGESAEAAALVPIKLEADVFRLSERALAIQSQPQPANARSLEQFHSRRQYPGSPPFIPHKVAVEGTIGGMECLTCHANGGYSAVYEQFAPVTPHPEMLNCRQCHVPQLTETLFAETNWESVLPPEINGSAMPGSPPPIPHGLQMRENCLSCHGGAAAAWEIRSNHPVRVNCRQCHVLNQAEGEFARAVTPAGAQP